MPEKMNLEAWLIARRAKDPRPWEALGVSRMHLYRVQTARCVPSYDLAARLAAAMVQDGITATYRGEVAIPLTAGVVIDHCSARMAARVKDKGLEIWPDAPWALALKEAL